MTEQDCKDCQVSAVTLKRVSLLGIVLFITIPSTFMTLQNNTFSTFEKILLLIFFLTGFLLAFRSCHLFFDSQLLKNLGTKKMTLTDVDQIVLRIFRKNIQGKTVEVRIKSCNKLVKGFFVLLVLHLLCYVGALVFFGF
jgi:hypothetical protein